jgi:hypothetical protein
MSVRYVVVSRCAGCSGPIYGPEEVDDLDGVETMVFHAEKCPLTKPERSGK